MPSLLERIVAQGDKKGNTTPAPATVLQETPRLFVETYWKYMDVTDIKELRDILADDGFYSYYSRKIRNFRCKEKIERRNKRFAAMKALMKQGEYFTLGEMKTRHPVLYDELVGQLLSDDDVKNLAVEQYETYTSASKMLLGQMDNMRTTELYYKMLEHEGEYGRSTAEVNEEEDEDEEMGEDVSLSEKTNRNLHSEQEKELLTREFVSEMEQRFLTCVDDADIVVTDTPEYEQDTEDAYFDSEEATSTDVVREPETATQQVQPEEVDYLTMDLSSL